MNKKNVYCVAVDWGDNYPYPEDSLYGDFVMGRAFLTAEKAYDYVCNLKAFDVFGKKLYFNEAIHDDRVPWNKRTVTWPIAFGLGDELNVTFKIFKMEVVE